MFEVVIEAWNTLYNNGPNPQTQEHGECYSVSARYQMQPLCCADQCKYQWPSDSNKGIQLNFGEGMSLIVSDWD